MIYVLVQAGEGYTETIIAGHGKEGLLANLKRTFQKEIDSYHRQEDRDYTQAELDAILLMLNNHIEWTKGSYVLPNIEQQWQEWTLFIEE